jgi:leader peptidase (prepilin peptidase)/N-methyltransferase
MSIFVFIFGTLIGSFLNVVILRWKTGWGLWGRSRCMSCGKTLQWFELVPFFSFLIQMGKCRKCKARLSWQYPLVEMISGLIWFFVYNSGLSLVMQAVLILISMILLIVSAYDILHQIIPDFFIKLLGILGIASIFIPIISYPVPYTGSFFVVPSWEAILAGPLVALPFFAIFMISKKRAMGFGDVKLSLVLGWFLGVSYGFSMIFISILLGGLFGVFYLTALYAATPKKKRKKRHFVPFGPFIAIAFFIVVMLSISFTELFSYFGLVI